MATETIYRRATTEAALTASTPLATFNADDYDDLMLGFFVNGAVSGTTPALALTLQVQMPETLQWLTVASGANVAAQFGAGVVALGRGQATVAGAGSATGAFPAGRMRVLAVVSGTTPSFAGVEVVLWGERRGNS